MAATKKTESEMLVPTPDPAATIDALMKDRAGLVSTMHEIEHWARYHDHAIRMKAIHALEAVGEAVQ